ncbi:MAG: PQQ-binding-like beta-propeller repeat protein [Phycisphaeraceae bacterium]
MQTKHNTFMTCPLCLLLLFALAAPPTFADDWPQWMGPNRDDVWHEKNIIESFPEKGLTFLWRTPINGGFSGPAVAGGKVFVTDYQRAAGDYVPKPTTRNALQGKERVLCLDARTGREIWKHEYDCPYEISYAAGPRCTPTVSAGKVYTLGAMGDLYCLDADKGTVIWSKNLPKAYSADVPLWGYAGHPLVYKNTIIITPGGKDSAVVALHKDTGDEVWKSLDTRKPGYSPPTLIEAGGTTQLLIFHGESLNSLDPDTGRLHWSQPIATAYAMAIMAPRQGGDYLFAGGHNGKSIGLKLDADKPAATKVWTGSRNLGLAPVSGTPFVEDNIAYGIDSDGFFRAIRIDTGQRLWATARPVNGRDETEGRSGAVEGATFITKNGNRFFLFGENGDLIIARLSAEKYNEVSRTKLLDPVGLGLGRKIVWSHPAYANQCVFARNDKEIVCASLAIR